MASGFSDVLIGLQYGDEGKARIIDTIAHEYDVIARFNGGSNAGHTIESNGKRISLHQVPSGIFHDDKILYIGSGCVVNPEKLMAEIAEISALGLSLAGRFHISSLATLVQPHHVLVDQMTGGHIGTTGQGIGPAYADRALRLRGTCLLHIRTGDLLSHPENTFKHVRENLEVTLKTMPGQQLDIEKTMQAFTTAALAMVQYIQDDTLFMPKLAAAGKRILFEGAQSFMLDVVKGSVPFVTSSATLAAAAYVGGDLPPKFHRKTIGVAKAIMSRVGNGPFVSEFGGVRSEEYCMADRSVNSRDVEKKLDVEKLLASADPFEVGKALRILGYEYGATTGRPRRVGSLDLVQLAYAARSNGVDELYLNKCDLLKDFARTAEGTIPLVTGYISDGHPIDYVPASVEIGRAIKPVTEGIACFTRDIAEARKPSDLPAELTAMLKRISASVCPVRGIGVGPAREQYVAFPEDSLKKTAA